ncbi:hypothetical protein [Bacillus sp. Marseille-P3800]|uniref:hypothetical protein n=1 Tax=Bacillus sp. Marseille-P3800 TaxID=2014782 RepID=UPI000C083D5A|nr:hypothetical protein [Bacillus sp. Marseille-P3800]
MKIAVNTLKVAMLGIERNIVKLNLDGDKALNETEEKSRTTRLSKLRKELSELQTAVNKLNMG